MEPTKTIEPCGETCAKPKDAFYDTLGYDGFPPKKGLYNPEDEKDACGVGFVVNIKGTPSHDVVSDALTLLDNMKHRGACGCEENTGDGAGIMVGIPHDYYEGRLREEMGLALPAKGSYATGILFLNKDSEIRQRHMDQFCKIASTLNLQVFCWREVKTDNSMIGESSLSREPYLSQVFVTSERKCGPKELQKLVFMLRKRATHMISREEQFYICSLSLSTIVYKGMLTATQVPQYFVELQDPSLKSHLALVHSRFSTNTFPSWPRAQPMRLLGHNGEINTLRGNKNWMRAREGRLQSENFKEETTSLFPIIEAGGSDSASFDNVLEFLLNDGSRSLPELIMLMVPEAWQNDENMDEKKKAFYEWGSFIMEPWDGPALFTFTDGRYIGGVLDRNGLRPSRYYVTNDDRMIMASEVGVVQVSNSKIKEKGRLQPGMMLLVDTEAGTIVNDADLKTSIADAHPFRNWLVENAVYMEKLVEQANPQSFSIGLDEMSLSQDRRLTMFGYTIEQINMLVLPMIQNKKEALGSMGNDAPLACLSQKPRLVYEYFKQLFAQVTNPPIDPFREAVVMSLRCAIGPEGNILGTDESQCQRLVLDNPVLSGLEFEQIKGLESSHLQWSVQTLDATFPVSQGSGRLEAALDRLCEEAAKAIDHGAKILVLSDRKASVERAPVPTLLACSTVHHYLVNQKTRMKVALVLETGEAREVHHHCLLVGYGADAIFPYLVYETVAKLRREGLLEASVNDHEVAENYKKAVATGIRKVMAKMGISTLQSYKGAQIFEAVGLGPEVMEKCFHGTASRVKGLGFDLLAEECLSRHSIAFPTAREMIKEVSLLENPGDYHWRDGGEVHTNTPAAIANLQDASRRNDKGAYWKFAEESEQAVKNCTLRGLLEFDYESADPVPLGEVESAAEIVKRFCTGAMSYGSISIEAHTTLAAAMNRMGAKSNTGEGGEDTKRFEVVEGQDSLRSAIKQVASGRFGVTVEYLSNSDEIQIKMAQGAKPGEGGELPGHKVSETIAATRHSTPGVGLISPPPHHDIYSIEDLAQLIYDLKCSNPSARISVKLVSEVGVGVIAAGVVKGHADHVLISGHDGGTGASSWTGIKHAGLPWELGLAETHQVLVQNNLRGRTILQTDGQLKTGRDCAIACLLGAEEFGFATVPLIVMGCTMMRKCHLNTCPVGIATQDPELRKKFTGSPEHVVNYFFMVAEHMREIMARLGCRTVNEMVGRTDLLRMRTGLGRKASTVDLSCLLTLASSLRPGVPTFNVEKQNHYLEERLDNGIIAQVDKVLESQPTVALNVSIKNTDRAFATTLSHHLTIRKKQGLQLEDGAIRLDVKGSAGQSFGAFLCQGVKLILTGDANDYVGKGLSGGTIVIRPDNYAPEFVPENNIIAGNVCLYGATSGKAFFRGIVAERFCVRNSGAVAVCEGVGDHGCEYMTGGRAVILGRVGRNFAAGMSGGIAYIFDPEAAASKLVNGELVDLDQLEDKEEKIWLRTIIHEHAVETGSTRAASILQQFEESLPYFVRVMPRDYRAALEKLKAKELPSSPVKKDVLPLSSPVQPEAPPSPPQDGLRSPSEIGSPVADIEETIVDKEVVQKKMEKLDKLRGFMKYNRRIDPYRDPKRRTRDFNEINRRLPEVELKTQAARCMDCGVPFCQSDTGCPLGNVIPQWNDLVYKGEWREALDRLLLTNNFPEFTGRVCPAPCEGSCVLGINADPVSIKSIEAAIIDYGYERGWIAPNPPRVRTKYQIAIVGSGPAGLAAADQLNKAGHNVTVYEREDRIGGLLMYGIPNMKLDKGLVQKRIDIMAAEGIRFVTGAEVGKNVDAAELLASNDALLLATGATWPRDLRVPGRQLAGIDFAMNFLTPTTKSLLDKGLQVSQAGGWPVSAKGKRVIVIGGGDTATDCIGTSVRQGATSVICFEILPQPPETRAGDNPWPTWPKVFRVDYGHAEVRMHYGHEPRHFNIMTKEFLDDGQGHVKAVKTVQVHWEKDAGGRWIMKEVPGSERVWECDLVLLAMGFLGPEKLIADKLGVDLDGRSNFATSPKCYATSINKVYAAGDCRRGQSLVVWAISEGRQAAREIDLQIIGSSTLPLPGGVIPRRQEVLGPYPTKDVPVVAMKMQKVASAS